MAIIFSTHINIKLIHILMYAFWYCNELLLLVSDEIQSVLCEAARVSYFSRQHWPINQYVQSSNHFSKAAGQQLLNKTKVIHMKWRKKFPQECQKLYIYIHIYIIYYIYYLLLFTIYFNKVFTYYNLQLLLKASCIHQKRIKFN